MKKIWIADLRLHTFVLLIVAVVCAICVYRIFGRRTVVPLSCDTSQFCTNQVIDCFEDNAHPGVVVLGYNRKVFMTALDVEKTGFATFQIVNCTSNVVGIKCVANEMWDVEPTGNVSPGETDCMSIWLRETRGGYRKQAGDPDVALYDENSGELLCELFVRIQDAEP